MLTKTLIKKNEHEETFLIVSPLAGVIGTGYTIVVDETGIIVTDEVYFTVIMGDEADSIINHKLETSIIDKTLLEESILSKKNREMVLVSKIIKES